MKKLFLLLSILCSAFAGFADDSQAPKYVFYFIGDGMGLGHVNIAQTYWRTHVDAENPLTMYQFPIALACNTYSAKNHITDSAAAGSALSTGTKTRNGMLGMDADTVATYSVALDYKNKGYGIAIATSVYPDDATPGAFYTHVPARSMYTQIGFDMAKSQYDMFAGS